MIHLNLQVTVEKPRTKTFENLTNFENFATMIPEFYPHLKVKSKRDNVCVIEQHLVLGKKEFVMMTKHVVDYPNSHEFFVIGGDCKGSSLKEELFEDDNSTKIIISGEFKIPRKFGLLKTVSRQEILESLESIIKKLNGS